jgi:sugar lactone lactonase YvrE
MIRPTALGVVFAAMLVVASPASAAVGLLDAFGTKGSGDGQFRYPSDLALDSAGNIYVADQDNQRIQKLAPDGRLLAKFGSGSLAEGQMAPGAFDDPSGVGIDSAGNVWVVENDNKRVQKLAPDGSPLLVFGGDAGFSDPKQLALAPSGDVYVTDLNGSVFRFAPDGTLLGTFGQGLETPRGIAVDRAGNVLVADRDQFRVAVFSPTGELLRTISRPLAQGALYAMDVAVDPSGDIWVLTDGSGLMKFSPGGGLLATVFDSLRGEDRPAYDAFGIVAEAGGSVLVADTQLGRILRYGQGGRVQGGAGGGALISLRLSPRAFRAARRGPSISPRGGTTVTYVVAAPARVRFTVRRAVRGTYRRVRGAFAHRGSRGANSFHFSGRVGGRRLRPGRYRLVATTRGAPAPRRIGFRIVR